MMTKISFEDFCILSLIRLGRFWVRVLPAAWSLAAARAIGSAVYFTGKRRHVAYKNLRMAFAFQKSPRELKRIARRSIQNLAVSAVEMLRIPDMTREYVETHITVQGRENFEPYLRDGKGVIFLTGHFGSWELLNVASALLGYPTTALARVQKHPRSDAYLNGLRRSKGSQVIHKGMPLREILHALKAGRIVGILSDQDGGKNGSFVEFFGRLSSTPPGAAAFSLRTGAPIVPTFITREKGDRHRIAVGPALKFPPPGMTEDRAEASLLQQFARALEAKIRRTPEQWLWSHRRWKSSPDRQVLVLSDGKAGHLNQSMAVLDAVRRERKAHGAEAARVHSSLVEVRFRSRAAQKTVRAMSLAMGGHLFGRRFWMRWMLTPECYETLLHSYADVVISCGSSLVDVNLWMKNENHARSVVVMKPSFPSAHFDAVIAPRHDRLEDGPGVFRTEGALSALRPEDLEIEASVLAAELDLESGRKRIGVLVGGDTVSRRFERETFEGLTAAVRAAAEDASAQVLLTTSRRTPAWAEESLKRTFTDRALCPLFLVANEANRAGAVPGILGLSDALVVTAESMSMLSEAASSGKPVLVVRPWRGPLKQKYEEYLSRLEADGRLLVCTAQDLREKLKKALSGEWSAASGYRRDEEAVLHEAVRKVIV